MKRSLIKYVTLASTALLLTACGNTDDSKGGDTNAAGDGPVEISVWLTPQWKGVMDGSEEGADHDSFFEYAGEKFAEQYDKHDVKVNVEVIAGDQRDEMLNVNLNGGTPPDVFFESVFAMGDYAHRGALVPLDDIIDESAREDIEETFWDNVEFGDETYFYPFSHMPGTLVYNADMFEAAGLSDFVGGKDEIKTWTMDEFNNILNTLKTDTPKDQYSNAYPMGQFAVNNQGDTWNLAYLRMFGNEFFNGEGELVVGEPSGVKAAEYLQSLNQDGLTNPGPESVSSNDVNAMFQNQQLGISFTNSVLYNNILTDMENGDVEEFDARLANIPSESGDPLSFTYVTGAAVFDTKDETRIEVAKDFVKFFSTDEELVKASKNGVPVRKSVVEEFEDENPLFAAYEKNAPYMFNFTGNVPGYGELRQVLYPELQAIYTGEKSPEEAMKSYQEKGNDVIKNAKEDSVIYNK